MLAMNILEVTIDELVERYSALLFDAYGVLSYTVGALPGAVDLIDRLNAMGKPYYVLTNDSSALPENRAARYRKVGLKVDSERLITSGSLLKGYFAAQGLSGRDALCWELRTARSLFGSPGAFLCRLRTGSMCWLLGISRGFPLCRE